jgi:WxcM-like, C-terminal
MALVTLSRVGDARLIELSCHRRDGGELVVAEAATGVPFAIARIFTVTASLSAERGKHAHRLCSQLMLCVHGAVDIVCDDGTEQRSFALDRGNLALLVPPMLWNTLIFRKPDSVLVAVCDRPYEEDDYLRDYPEFLAQRKAIGA